MNNNYLCYTDQDDLKTTIQAIKLKITILQDLLIDKAINPNFGCKLVNEELNNFLHTCIHSRLNNGNKTKAIFKFTCKDRIIAMRQANLISEEEYKNIEPKLDGLEKIEQEEIKKIMEY